MATYVMSDLHGDYNGYKSILKQITFNKSDTLYINGDVLDRGSYGLKILLDMMLKPNIYPIFGNHEYAAYQCLKFLMEEVTEDNIEKLDAGFLEGLLEWQSIGGQTTIDEFHKLNHDERQSILDYLEEFSLFETITVAGNDFVIVHAGLDNFNKSRPLEDYELHELIFKSPDYDKIYFDDKYLVTGHLPTRVIDKNPKPDHIYIKNNHIALDCGAGFGGQVGCICLDNFEEFYSKDI